MCLQGKARDAGLLPASPAPVAVEASTTPAEPAAPVAPEADTDAALVEPELDVVPLDAAAAAALAAPEDLIAATFGLLRAEPDGSVVIAGSGTPGSEIEVYSNGTLLGKTIVEASGDWVLVPDVRIAPGGTEITLGETGKTGLAQQSFVVAINEDKTSEPLVVASTPGAISEVLQGLPSTSAASTTQMAAVDPKAAAATPQPAASAQPAAPATTATTTTATTTAATTAATAAVTAAATEAAAAVEAATTTAAAAVDQATAATVAAGTEQAAAQTNTAMAADTADGATPAAATDAAAQAVANAAAAATAAIQPAVAPASPSDPAAAATETTIAVATADPATPAADVVAGSVATALDVAAPTIDAVEVEGDKSFFAGSGANGATVRLYVDDVFVADTVVTDGRWLIEAGKVLTKPSQRVRVDMLANGSASVASRAEVDFFIDLPASAEPTATAQAEAPAQPAEPVSAAETPTAPETAVSEPAVPTMVAVTIGNADDQRFAAGKAIIRRGDNLWTIARRVYGEGLKYTTIYQANTGQIRDPDRIYPGQVFDLPVATEN